MGLTDGWCKLHSHKLGDEVLAIEQYPFYSIGMLMIQTLNPDSLRKWVVMW